MYKKVSVLLIMVGLCATTAWAQQQEKKIGPTISAWLKSIQQKIALIAPKKIIPMSTGVAGVRGSKEEGQTRLYWKGKKEDETVSEEELAKFKTGVDLADKGDKDGSIKELDAFMRQHPDSALIPDAKKTLDMLKTEGK